MFFLVASLLGIYKDTICILVPFRSVRRHSDTNCARSKEERKIGMTGNRYPLQYLSKRSRVRTSLYGVDTYLSDKKASLG